MFEELQRQQFRSSLRKRVQTRLVESQYAATLTLLKSMETCMRSAVTLPQTTLNRNGSG